MMNWLLLLTLANPWALQQQIAPGRPEAIGAYSAGCLQGAEALPLSGPGYQVLRPAQRRYYGHPELIDYLQDLARQTRRAGVPELLIGDLAMLRGGPFNNGHRSHQTGLDADIWFRFAPRPLSPVERNRPRPLDLVDHDRRRLKRALFQPAHYHLLRLAASDPRVDRIFVSPPIKLELCRRATGSREWLRKIRPWFGHSAHLHVRLRCPADSRDCQPQKRIPAGDGCGAELFSWLDEPTAIKPSPLPPPRPILPRRCERLLAFPRAK